MLSACIVYIFLHITVKALASYWKENVANSTPYILIRDQSYAVWYYLDIISKPINFGHWVSVSAFSTLNIYRKKYQFFSKYRWNLGKILEPAASLI
jgi:hypothetical protein